MLPILLLTLSLFAHERGDAAASVYVFTRVDASGFVDDDQKLRLEAVANLKKSLSAKKLTVSEKPENAAIHIEIVALQRRTLGESSTRTTRTPGAAQSVTSSGFALDMLATMRVGDYVRELKASGSTWDGWKGVAGLMANQIRDWAKDNSAKLVR